MNVIGYVRVSTSGQAKDGYSLAYQQDEIRSFCQEQGWNLMNIFSDEGISGAKVDEEALEVDRIGFQSMLAALSIQTIDAVVVLNTSHLWRSDIVKVLVHREFKKYGVDVRSIEQPTYSIYKKDPNDFLINGLMELLDQYQRLEVALKLGRGRHKKAEQGGYAGGRATFGYRAKKGQKYIQVDEKQAQTVRRLFQLKEEHPLWSLTQIAEAMNEEGFTTQQGRLFTKVQIKRILDRRNFYSGIYRYGNIQANGLHEAIL
ncbi:recombinase family protein [Brevibacillus humidisoli]|uniref:recombinase family protein n=1 Tax=Brevibacillus humidisoli TaxID=2895522 RepID=UPI001E3FF64C|nr:recombinase family protein [Brevibacillus humidisoli]UFJ40492.1 recombinase family protein [Brevibacillus humidisoli]